MIQEQALQQGMYAQALENGSPGPYGLELGDNPPSFVEDLEDVTDIASAVSRYGFGVWLMHERHSFSATTLGLGQINLNNAVLAALKIQSQQALIVSDPYRARVNSIAEAVNGDSVGIDDLEEGARMIITKGVITCFRGVQTYLTSDYNTRLKVPKFGNAKVNLRILSRNMLMSDKVRAILRRLD